MHFNLKALVTAALPTFALAFNPAKIVRLGQGILERNARASPPDAATLPVEGRVPSSSSSRSSSSIIDGPELPPQDHTCSLIGSIKEILAGPDAERIHHGRYEGIGRGSTGGVWRSRIVGLLPATILAAPTCTAWMTRQEAMRNVVMKQQPNVYKLLGPKALANLDDQSAMYTKLRKLSYEAFSVKAAENLQPIAEAAISKRLAKWETLADSGQEFKMLDELVAITVEVIAVSFLGRDYTTDAILEGVTRLLPKFSMGFFSPVSRKLPWPLSKLPLLSYGESMDARAELVQLLRPVLHERKKDLRSPSDRSRTGGILDEFLKLQMEQEDQGGPGAENLELGDDFVLDNLLQFLFGGYETTAIMISRLLQVLASPEGKGIVDDLVHEFNGSGQICEDLSLRDEAKEDGQPAVRLGRGTGMFESYPLLAATVSETYRLNPMVPGVLRKTVREVEYNGYKIPADETLYWGFSSAFTAASVYPEPERFCPFRFVHDSKSPSQDSADPHPHDVARVAGEQPRPQMFGAGRHMCPGRELAKMEIIMFLRAFLAKFDYDLVEGQSFKAIMPLNAPKDNLRVVVRKKAKPLTSTEV